MNNNSIILLIFQTLFFLHPIYGQEITETNKKLLVFVKFENNNTFNVADSLSHFTEEKCLKIYIDTISTSGIETVKHKKDIFKYNNNFYSKKQLFPVSAYKDLLEFKIIKFTVSTSLLTDIRTVDGEGGCFGYEQKFFLYNYCRRGKQLCCTSKERSCFYIDGVHLFDGKNRTIIINYGEIEFK